MKVLVFIILFLTNVFACSDTIKVGVLKFAPPFSSIAGNGQHFFGFTIDLMDAICKRLNKECIYISTTVEQQFDSLNQGIIDVSFIPIPISSENSDTLIYSLPYLVSNGQFLAVEHSDIKNWEDIKNKKIGVMKNTLASTLLNSRFANTNEIKEYSIITDLLAALADHEVDVIYVNASIGRFIINNAVFRFQMVGKKIPLGEGYGVLALKKNADLIKNINRALLDMESDGSYIKIYNQYFSQ